jgi:anhydro-N-acetylmuramic acid kinase
VIVMGLMSGTSMDGIDVALLDLDGDVPDALDRTLLAFRSIAYGRERRERLRAAVDAGGAEALCALHADLGEWLGEAACIVLEEVGVSSREVAVVGSHGHTAWHRPPSGGRRGATLQLGDPATIAARTGVPVVSDFRSADVAAGGHGAPLVPWADRILFSVAGRARVLQNLGGVGNLTWLPPRGTSEPPVAFDTGPGNGLLDAAARQATGGASDMDADGVMAAAGLPDPGLLASLLAHPFLGQSPPRSTGREAFGPSLVATLAEEWGLRSGTRSPRWNDLLATLTEFTAHTIADAYRSWILPLRVDEVVLTGGGARNPELVKRIAAVLAPLPVLTGAEALGMDPDAREAAAFALLAWAHAKGHPANVPAVTGASGPRILGSWTPAPQRTTYLSVSEEARP